MNFAEIEHCNIINANEECDSRLRKPNDKILWLNLCVFRNFVVCNSFDNCRCYFLSHLIIAACLSRRNKRRKHQLAVRQNISAIYLDQDTERLQKRYYLPSAAMLHGQKAYPIILLFIGRGDDATFGGCWSCTLRVVSALLMFFLLCVAMHFALVRYSLLVTQQKNTAGRGNKSGRYSLILLLLIGAHPHMLLQLR